MLQAAIAQATLCGYSIGLTVGVSRVRELRLGMISDRTHRARSVAVGAAELLCRLPHIPRQQLNV